MNFTYQILSSHYFGFLKHLKRHLAYLRALNSLKLILVSIFHDLIVHQAYFVVFQYAQYMLCFEVLKFFVIILALCFTQQLFRFNQ